MTQLNPYLQFNGNCREAMTFYQACLGGELKMQTVGESQLAGQMPPETQKNILHSSLEKDGFVLFGADMIGPERVVKGNAINLCLVCSSVEETHTFFAKLSSGGAIGHPLEEVFFGTFGSCTDKFGINWMCQFDKNSQA